MILDLSVVKTLTHITQVQRNLNKFAFELVERGVRHDASKLTSPELEAFARLAGNLSQSEYNSQAYHDGIRQLDLNGALTHHYENNSHHPEHYKNGVDGMTLLDLVEMYCDWDAATLRQKDGDLLTSIDVNEKRFNLSPQLAQIFRNTASSVAGHPAPPKASPTALSPVAPPPAAQATPRDLVDVPDWLNITSAQVTPGTEYWRLKKVQYWGDQKSGGTHHIYTKSPHDSSAKMVVSNGQQQWKVPLEKPTNEPSSNFAMWGGNYYKAWMDGIPSDSIEGMHMPAKHHVSYLLWWEKAVASDIAPKAAPEAAPPPRTHHTDFVQTSGTKFSINGQPLRFVGTNVRGLIHYGGGRLLPHSHDFHADAQLRASQEMGARVIRVFGANRHLSKEYTGNRLQHMLEKVAAYDMYMIFSFTDVHHDTGFNVPSDDRFYQDNRLNKAWYEGGYRENYLPFVRYLVERFKDHPRIFAWELGNELKARDGNAVLPDLFIQFAKDVSSEIREIDRNHLITTGIINSGNLGCSPSQAKQLYSLPSLDFMTAHVYYSQNNSNQWMGLEAQRADHDADLAQQINMPFIIEEIGFEGGDRVRLTEHHLHKWFDQKRAAGFMQWGLMATNQDIGDGDNRFGIHRNQSDYIDIARCIKHRATMCTV